MVIGILILFLYGYQVQTRPWVKFFLDYVNIKGGLVPVLSAVHKLRRLGGIGV